MEREAGAQPDRVEAGELARAVAASVAVGHAGLAENELTYASPARIEWMGSRIRAYLRSGLVELVEPAQRDAINLESFGRTPDPNEDFRTAAIIRKQAFLAAGVRFEDEAGMAVGNSDDPRLWGIGTRILAEYEDAPDAAEALTLASGWPLLAALRQAASARKALNDAVSSLTAAASFEFTAARLAASSGRLQQDSRAWIESVACTLRGEVRYYAVRRLLQGGMMHLACLWRWKQPALDATLVSLRRIVGLPTEPTLQQLPDPVDPAGQQPVALGHVNILHAAAISSGWRWEYALRLFSRLGRGVFDATGHVFDTIPQPGPGPAWLSTIVCGEGDDRIETKVWVVGGLVAKIESWGKLRLDPPPGMRRGNMVVSARTGKLFVTRFLPAYIRYPTDENGVLAPMPERWVTSLYERRERWVELLGHGALDNAARAIVFGKLVYPMSRMLGRTSWLANHPSFERQEVKDLMGRKVGKYLVQGMCEWIGPNDPLPAIIEPNGAVDKEGPDRYRLITDARYGN